MSQGRRYKIHAVLGQGGFGTVYMAELLGEGGFTRKVALKVLNPDMVGIEDVANRLRDEARLLGLLRHRAIVQVDGLVMLSDRWTVVMEYIEGVDLQRVVRTAGPMPLGPALEVISEVASALDVAYMTPGPTGVPLHLLHRDIKPPNIVLTAAGETKVLDFGIARAEFSEREAKTKSVLYGSIGYMAPERMEFEELPAGDVYALGTVLFELLDGHPLGKGSINPQKHKGHVDAAIQRLLKKVGPVPPEFPELLTSMLAYEPEERPTAREVERRCRALRGAVNDPWLRDWAESVVPPVIVQARGEHRTDDFSGSIVVERSSRSDPDEVRTPAPAASAGKPPPPPTKAPRADETFAIDGPASPPSLPSPPSAGPPPSDPKSWATDARPARPKRRSRGWGGTIALLGCVVLVGGGVLVAAIFGATATGGLLAVVAMNAPVDTGTYVYVPPDPVYTDPGVIPEVPDAGAQDYGIFGVVASLTEPWKSIGVPVGDGVVGYSDATSLLVTYKKGPARSIIDRYAEALVKKGWSKQYDFAMEGTISLTFTKGSESIALSVMDYEGQYMLSMAKY